MTAITVDPIDLDNTDATLQQLHQLRELAKTSAQAAQDQAWTWIDHLGKTDNQDVLATLFAQGSAENPCTRTLGIPVGPMRNIAGGAFISAYLKIDSPWTGKTFHQDGHGGFNRIKSYTKIPVSILAPFHRLTRHGNE